MKTLSNLIGKPIISIYNGSIEGYVKNLLFDKKLTKLCAIVVVDDKTQEEKLLLAKSVYKTGQDAIVLKNNTSIILNTTDNTTYTNPTNKDVFSVDGNKVGKIADVAISEDNKIEYLILQNNSHLLAGNILNTGSDIIVVKPQQQNVKISYFKDKPVFKTTNNNQIVQIQNNITKPNRLLANNYGFLLGRKTNKNIYADNGELLVKKQTKITNFVIDNVCKNGKLKELATSSHAQ